MKNLLENSERIREQCEHLNERGYQLVTESSCFTADVLQPLYAQMYWAKDRSLTTIAKSLKNSLSYGIFYKGEPVAFARLITDYATFAYLCDVVVDERHRGLGLSKWLLTAIFSNPEIATLRRWSLITKDAQGLYAQFGFKPSDYPDRYMEVLRV